MTSAPSLVFVQGTFFTQRCHLIHLLVGLSSRLFANSLLITRPPARPPPSTVCMANSPFEFPKLDTA